MVDPTLQFPALLPIGGGSFSPNVRDYPQNAASLQDEPA